MDFSEVVFDVHKSQASFDMAASFCFLASYRHGHRRLVGKNNDEEQASHRFRDRLPEDDLHLNFVCLNCYTLFQRCQADVRLVPLHSA